MNVDIVLPTYQGEAYIRAQIDSILQQTYRDFTLYIRDDGSTDDTLKIIRKFHDPRIKILSSDHHVGIRKNITLLLQESKAPVIFFSDQDDVWENNKITTMLKYARFNEPLLVYSDLSVVDQNLKLIAPSFWSLNNLFPFTSTKLNVLLNQNCVTGCAMMINRELKDKVLPIPEEAVMHDAWIALFAAAFGSIIPISEPLVKYRQHGKNQIGSTQYSFFKYLSKGFEKLLGKNLKYRKAQIQAKAFFDKAGSELKPIDCDMVKSFLELPKASYFESRRIMLKYGLSKQGFLRKLGFLLAPYNSDE